MGQLLLFAIMSVAGVASATQAISLANFTPRIENLPPSCSAAYTSTIEGCQAGDFAQNARCSAQCVQGLVKIAEVVTRQCAGVDVPETSIIGVFMLGAGVPAVCPGVQVTTIGKSSTAPPPPSTTRPPASSTTSSGSDDGEDEPTSTAAGSSASSTPASAASSTTSAAEQPSTTTRPQITLDTSIAPAPSRPAATTSASSQKSNADSGGGSPFDVQASAGRVSAPLRLGRGQAAVVLGLAILLTIVA